MTREDMIAKVLQLRREWSEAVAGQLISDGLDLKLNRRAVDDQLAEIGRLKDALRLARQFVVPFTDDDAGETTLTCVTVDPAPGARGSRSYAVNEVERVLGIISKPRKGPDMAYDPKCHELAEYFLTEDVLFPAEGKQLDAAKVAELAQDIQDAVENFFEHEKGNN